LRELDFGQAEGHTRAELARQFADAFQAFQDNPVDHPLPGGEDPYQAVERTVACFHDIAQAYPDGKVLVVFHSTLLRLTMCKLLNIPLRHYRTIFPFIRNGALTELHLQGDQASLLMYNSPIEAHVALTRSDPNTARAVL
jgi:probable phosphoglycerate mutase